MRIVRFARPFVLSTALALGLGASPANAGIEVKEFNFRLFTPTSTVDYKDTFSAGGPLVNPGATFQWIGRKGTFPDATEDNGLYLNPIKYGEEFTIASFPVKAQIMQLDTPRSGLGAINSDPSFFSTFAIYEWEPYKRDGTLAGIGLTDAFHGGTRAIAVGTFREQGTHYSKFFNALTGDTIFREELNPPPGTQYLEYFINREHPTSFNVEAGIGYRDEDLDLISFKSFGITIAFSDVVLHPVLFSAAVVPEPETWAMLIAGLAMIAWKVRRRRDIPRATGREPSAPADPRS